MKNRTRRIAVSAIAVVLSFAVLSFGFAAWTQTLTVTGVATAEGSFDVDITAVSVDGTDLAVAEGGVKDYTIATTDSVTGEPTLVKVNYPAYGASWMEGPQGWGWYVTVPGTTTTVPNGLLTLAYPGDSFAVTVEITNNSTVAVSLDDFAADIEVVMDGEVEAYLIDAPALTGELAVGASTTFTFTVTLNPDVTAADLSDLASAAFTVSVVANQVPAAVAPVAAE
ncbi:MAG: hypothetical protein LBL82_08585 [Oscillospiraceae bacterium]|jgi:hypothetical protein|nr:hypothetical protein [Oscillospiraceae bacterium]